MIRVSSFGADPCHLLVDVESSVLYSSNYSSGSLSATALMDDGQLGGSLAVIDFNSSSPTASPPSHIHEATLAVRNTLIINDLGTVTIYSIATSHVMS